MLKTITLFPWYGDKFPEFDDYEFNKEFDYEKKLLNKFVNICLANNISFSVLIRNHDNHKRHIFCLSRTGFGQK